VINRLDSAAEKATEPLRNNRMTNKIFGTASHVGDFSVVWHMVGLLRAIGSMDRLYEAIALSVALGCESLIVNQGVKRLFRRERPTVDGDERFNIRRPRTSSFPSGHASAATFAAILLTSFSSGPIIIVWWTIAAIVAVSRIVVRIHHASDIVGGIVTGAILATVALPIVNAFL
jgi:membrane-associated phospholipid phosphatase